jgi:hypothetical protein
VFANARGAVSLQSYSSQLPALFPCFYKACKIFLILFPQVVICKLIVYIFKGLKLNIVVNVIRRYKVRSFVKVFADARGAVSL